METIKKKINIRDFSEKFGENEPCNENNVPYNIDITTEGLSDVFTSITGIPKYDEIGIKYGTFEKYYNWIRKFILESEYYIPKKKKTEEVWFQLSKFPKISGFTDSIAVFSELPETTSGFSCENEDVICVNESADTFFNLFGQLDEAIKFLNVSETVILTGNYKTLKPFAEINVFIDEDIDNLGDEEQFIPEKLKTKRAGDFEWYTEKYNIGVYAIIDNKIYKRISGNVDNMRYNKSDWKICEYDGTESSITVNGFIESKLKYLKRTKTSIEDNGNELDFVFDIVNLRCELPYLINTPCNVVYDEKITAYTYDAITEINVEGFTGETYNQLTNSDIGRRGKITFIYEVGHLVNGESGDTGVIHEETLDYVVRSCTFTIGGTRYQKPYISIDYDSGEKPLDYIPNKRYAKVTYNTAQEQNMTEINAGLLIRDDRVIGIEDISFNENKIEIDRGSSASYEAFNVIGEVNSIEDIEKYHDDWFRIKGKND